MAKVDLYHAADVSVREILLEQLPVRFARAEPNIGLTFLSNLDLATRQSQVIDAMVYEMSSFVLAEKLVDKTVEKKFLVRVHRPASWWQHFKDDVLDRHWLTRWFVRWHPVVYQIEDHEDTLVANFKQYATFPAADIQMPEKYHKGVVVVKEFLTYE